MFLARISLQCHIIFRFLTLVIPSINMFKIKSIFGLLVVTGLLCSCGDGKKEGGETTVRDSTLLSYSVLSVLPHNADAFTQGLVIHNNKILESTGHNGTSWVGEVNPASGNHDKKIILDNQYFGEGITVLNNKLYYLTWTSRVGFIYDATTYKKLREFSYDPAIKQGWGLTHDNKNLIVSDGTDKIHFLDSADLKVVRTITVKDGTMLVKEINELEYVDGYIFANVWQTNWIVKIDPKDGRVVGKLDLSTIGNEIEGTYPTADVLNGIAYDKNSKAMLITGKLWPKAYLIRIQ
jgi:glutaminyl-peptide cyclotransferase